MSLANPPARPGSAAEFFRGLSIQGNVIGALIMREIHTRYGRDNVGYLWVILDPMLLAAAIGSLHTISSYGPGTRPVAFALGGYCVFIIFRGIIGRAESTLEANQPLLYHRTVSIFDMLLARALLEGLSILIAFIILNAGAWALGVADPPARPLIFIGAYVLMMWFSFSLSLLICAGGHFSKTFGRLVHPATYIAMPLSGAFFMLQIVPEPYRTWLGRSPLMQIFEMVRTGQFESIQSPYYHPLDIVAWCMAFTLVGLVAIRIVRRHVHLS